MKRPRLAMIAGFALFVGLILVDGPTVAAQDAVAVSPDIYKVELENQWVRVLRVKFGPRQSSKPHEQAAAVVVALTDFHLDIRDSSGRRAALVHKAGEVTKFNATTPRWEENPLNQPNELIVVELKPNAPPSPPIELDVVKLDPEHHPVVLETDRVRVLRTILEPRVKSPMHEHPHYVVVYLTELHTTMKMADGREVDNPRKPGEVAWRDALKHQTEQMGDKTAVEIQIELK